MDLTELDDGLSSEMTAEHFGYFSVSNKRGHWKNKPGVLENIRLLPEVLSDAKKFRVIIDYDPEFPRLLVQVFERQSSLQGQPIGKIGDDTKSS